MRTTNQNGSPEGLPSDVEADASRGVTVPTVADGQRGWYVWDRETGNACGYYPTEAEARDACDGFAAANPDFADAFVVGEDPT